MKEEEKKSFELEDIDEIESILDMVNRQDK